LHTHEYIHSNEYEQLLKGYICWEWHFHSKTTFTQIPLWTLWTKGTGHWLDLWQNDVPIDTEQDTMPQNEPAPMLQPMWSRQNVQEYN